MVDYAALALTAERLIEDNGRDVTFVKVSETPIDANEPWRGNTSAETTVVAKAVLSDYAKEDIDGDLIRTGDQRAVVAELSVTGNDLEEFEIMRDDENQEWRIINVDKVRPGPTTLVFVAQLRK